MGAGEHRVVVLAGGGPGWPLPTRVSPLNPGSKADRTEASATRSDRWSEQAAFPPVPWPPPAPRSRGLTGEQLPRSPWERGAQPARSAPGRAGPRPSRTPPPRLAFAGTDCVAVTNWPLAPLETRYVLH